VKFTKKYTGSVHDKDAEEEVDADVLDLPDTYRILAELADVSEPSQ